MFFDYTCEALRHFISGARSNGIVLTFSSEERGALEELITNVLAVLKLQPALEDLALVVEIFDP